MCNYCTLLVNDDVTRLNGHVGEGAPVIITYSFETPGIRGLQPSDATLRENWREAVKEAEAVAGVRFVEVERSANAMVDVAYNSNTNGVSWAYLPRVSEDWADAYGVVAMNQYYRGYEPGSAGYQVMLHELGHALGLKHPHEGPNRLVDRLDNTNNTVMSYEWRGRNKDAFQAYDRDALTDLYGDAGSLDGVAISWNGRRDVMSVVGTRDADTLLGVNDANAIAGRGGRDLLVGRMDDDTLRGGDGLDTLLGFDGEDRLLGGDRSDLLEGGWDDDTLLGGSGNDTLEGGEGWDVLAGGDGRDRLHGGAGEDTLNGAGQSDRLDGGDGNDVLIGGRGRDVLTGGDGADVFVLRRNSDNDRITDFSPWDGDRLDVGGLDMTRQEALARLEVEGERAVFDTGSGMVRFELIDEAYLTESLFVA